MTAKVLDGRYKLIKKLGAGGFGHTYIARDMRRPGTPMCVVKQLKPASNDQDFIREARRLFGTEAEVLEKLGKHDQIPQLLAYFEENNHFFLVQEFIEGTPLDQEWKPPVPAAGVDDAAQTVKLDQPLPPPKLLSEREAIVLLKDILGILEFVHAEGVIHRDIKPDNLIRRKSDGKIVLIDFGAVKSFQSEQAQQDSKNGESRFTVTIGTPGYMSSEQMAGRPNFTSDLYSLGMVIIRGLTGIEPTELPTNPDTGEIVWKDKARVSNGLAMVLSRMTRYSYPQRFQSAREALQGITALCPEDETSPTLIKQTTVRPKRSTIDETERTYVASSSQSNSGAGILVGGLFIIALIGVVGAPVVLNTRRSPESSNPAPTASEVPVPVPTASPTSSPVPIPTPDRPLVPQTQTVTFDTSGRFVASGIIPINTQLMFPFTATTGEGLQILVADASVVTMTITGQGGQPIAPNAVNVTSFQGQVPADGEVVVIVRSLKPENNTNFSISISKTISNPNNNF